ncbi:bile acid:sodium symporter [Catenulispora sp. MAP12-49]|uniref:bile acid:sodium symporter n=1 Tax=Catenulispora sp. MAP12-49 TaxID=3156302 RepID=UPI003514B519
MEPAVEPGQFLQAAGGQRAVGQRHQFLEPAESLASGLPMAAVLFPGHELSLMVLPLMVFHQVQLMACTVLARRWGNQGAGSGAQADGPAGRGLAAARA